MQQPEEGVAGVEKLPEEAVAGDETLPHDNSEKTLRHTFDSGSTLSPTHENEKGSNASQTALPLDDDAVFAHLSQHEKDILKKQLDAPPVKIGFFGLYRYASRMDIIILVVSAICAIAAGAALPLFTVSTSFCDLDLTNL